MIVRYLQATVLVLTVLTTLWFVFLRPGVDEDVSTGGELSSVPELERARDLRPQPLPSETETLAPVRQVIPGRAVHAPPVGEDVVRLPAPPVSVPPPRAVNLGIVVVETANRLSTRRGMVVLAGTRGVDEAASCQLEDGRTPPCHVLARTAVRRFVGQRQVSCTLAIRDDTSEDHVAPCTLAGTDLAAWVVEQGWAFADGSANADLQQAQSLAQQEQRGLWAHLSADAINAP